MGDVEKMQERIAINSMISDLPKEEKTVIKKYIEDYKRLLRGNDVSLESLGLIIQFYKMQKEIHKPNV